MNSFLGNRSRILSLIFIIAFVFLLIHLSSAQEISFSDQILITDLTDSPTSVFSTDLDDDGDQDVFSASDLDGKIAWYRNERLTSISLCEHPQLTMATSALLTNYPNPFKQSGAGRNPVTTISFQLSDNGEVNLSINNIKGKKIKTIVNEKLEQGLRQIIWDGKNDNNQYVASGVYFYKLNVNGKTEAVKKCLLLK